MGARAAVLRHRCDELARLGNIAATLLLIADNAFYFRDLRPNLVLLTRQCIALRRAVGAGVAVGCARLAQALGTAIGPGIAGVIYVRTGLSPAFSLYGTLAICAVLLAATGYGDRAKKKADPT